MPFTRLNTLARAAMSRPSPEGVAGPDQLLAQALRSPRGERFGRLKAMRLALRPRSAAEVRFARAFRFEQG